MSSLAVKRKRSADALQGESSKRPSKAPVGLQESIQKAIALIERSSNIILLVGAGISTSAGIPDFRSSDGLYASLKNGSLALDSQPPDIGLPELVSQPPWSLTRPRRNAALQGEVARQAIQQAEDKFSVTDPQELMSIEVFRRKPEVFYSFAKHVLPGNRLPTETHRWIRSLEQGGKMLRLYTQNIDQLEATAGIEAVVYCHGSFGTASCIRCKRTVPGTEIDKEIKEGAVPFCKVCKRSNSAKGQVPYLRPDITFFGEPIDAAIEEQLETDRSRADLLIVIGTSLLIPPVRDIPKMFSDIPQIMINREMSKFIQPEISLIGDCDDLVRQLRQFEETRFGECVSIIPEHSTTKTDRRCI